MRKPRILTILTAVAIVITTALVALPTQADEIDVYTTPGTHTVNGRQWRTTCEPYSQTKRCRTEIWATQVSQTGGRFVQSNGWVFNNLTFAASARSLWKNNPLAANGVVGGKVSWTATDGRKWRTECDTAITGRHGCRSYIQARVIESYTTSNGTRQFRWVTKEIFNNLVRFTVPTPAPKPTVKPTQKPTAKPSPTPTTSPTPTRTTSPTPTTSPTQPTGTIDLNDVVDPILRDCIQSYAGSSSRYLTAEQAAAVRGLICGPGIQSLEGFPHLLNLGYLELDGNQISDLTPLAGLTNLGVLTLSINQISDLTPLAGLTNLTVLNLSLNQISDLTPLAQLTNLTRLSVGPNQISDLTPLAQLTNLTELSVGPNQISDLTPLAQLTNLISLELNDNQISDLTPLAGLTNLIHLNLDDNQISDLTPLAGLTNLGYLALDGNQISDVTPLAGLTNLANLFLDDNQISDLTPLAGLTNLDALYLRDNPVENPAVLNPLVDGGTHIVWP